jgi:hypothetical protein
MWAEIIHTLLCLVSETSCVILYAFSFFHGSHKLEVGNITFGEEAESLSVSNELRTN